MNKLLLEQPIYVNRLYIHIAGELDAGIFLDTLFKKFNATKTNYLELSLESIYRELYYHPFEIKKIHKKLNKLPFIIIKDIATIKDIPNQNFSYTIDLQNYESYLNDMEKVLV